MSLYVSTFDTAIVPEHRIEALLRELFDLTPAAIIAMLALSRPIYRATATYGHFGRDGFPWEQTDQADAIRNAAL